MLELHWNVTEHLLVTVIRHCPGKTVRIPHLSQIFHDVTRIKSK